MSKYSFIYKNTDENKDYFKAIKCSELVIAPLTDGFKKVTIIEENDEELDEVVNDNYDIINAMMEGR